MTDPHVQSKKLTSFSTLNWKIALSERSPFFFLAGFLSLMKIQAMISQNRQMKPKIRNVHAMPMLLLVADMIKGSTRPPIPEPPEARPNARPLLLLNHKGAVPIAVC